MTELDGLSARRSASPWSLYQSDRWAELRRDRERDGFYVGMLKSDLGSMRYAYELSLVADGADKSVASEVLFGLLNDFNLMDYDREPAALVCDFADGLLAESVSNTCMLLELHALPDEHNRAKSSARSRRVEGSHRDRVSRPSLGYIPQWSVSRTRRGAVHSLAVVDESSVTIPSGAVRRAGIRRANLSRWQRAVADLGNLDKYMMIGADSERLSWAGYVFSDHRAAKTNALMLATTPIGWNARGSFEESVTSPYTAYRRLRFTRFWVEVVEDAVAFLNQFTTSTELYGTSAFAFSIPGAPSPNDLTAAMEGVRDGTLTVAEAHNKYLFPRRGDRHGGDDDEAVIGADNASNG